MRHELHQLHQCQIYSQLALRIRNLLSGAPYICGGKGGCSGGLGCGLKSYGNLTVLHIKFCLFKAIVTKDQKYQKPFLERDYTFFALKNKVLK